MMIQSYSKLIPFVDKLFSQVSVVELASCAGAQYSDLQIQMNDGFVRST